MRRGGAERSYPWSLPPKSLYSSETVRSQPKPDCREDHLSIPPCHLIHTETISLRLQKPISLWLFSFYLTFLLLLQKSISLFISLSYEEIFSYQQGAYSNWVLLFSEYSTPTQFSTMSGLICLLLFSILSAVQVKIVNRSRLHQVPCWLKLITELQQRAQLRRKSKMARQVIFLINNSQKMTWCCQSDLPTLMEARLGENLNMQV